MSQHDYVIDNSTGASVRADINNVLGAIVSQNSGASAPSTTYAYMIWADTANGLLKQRNAANSGWEIIGALPVRGLTKGTDLVQNPFALNSTVTQAHGLTVMPDLVTGYFECLTGELNYSVGDRVDMACQWLDGAAVANGWELLKDATNLVLITHTSANPIILNKTTRAIATITAANWKLVLTPWRIGQ